MKKFLAHICFCMLLPTISLAAPTISSIGGTANHNQSITISGSGFGVKSPAAPALWDNGMAYSASNGQAIPTPAGCVDGFSGCSGTNPYGWAHTSGSRSVFMETINPRGVWPKHYSNRWSTAANKLGSMAGYTVAGVTTTKKMYVTWWLYSDGPFDLPSTSGGGSNKFARFLSTDDWCPSGMGFIIWEPEQLFSSSCDYMGTGYFGGNHWAGTPALLTSNPGWNRMEALIDSSLSSSQPSYQVWANNVSGDGYQTSPGNSEPFVINNLGNLGADLANGTTPNVDWGEIYADDTPARVEICSGSTWGSKGRCEIQIPSAWSSSSVTATVNRGSFGASDSAYLYIIDSTNIANSSGFAIQFGGSNPPASPAGLKITN